MPVDESGSKHREEEYRIGWKMGGLGLEVSSQVIAGALLGWLYDKWQGTAPAGITWGAIAGIVVGMWTLIRGALKLNAELEKHHPTKGRGKPIPYDDDDAAQGTDAGDGWGKDDHDQDDEHD